MFSCKRFMEYKKVKCPVINESLYVNMHACIKKD